jgi:lipoprotein-anchoring transpeptidase ErfK/SrfK
MTRSGEYDPTLPEVSGADTTPQAQVSERHGAIEGYYLKNVLWTQYFTSDGASIHYNYWSSNWGYAGSHGCLGVAYNEARFAWNWADVGTPVYVFT